MIATDVNTSQVSLGLLRLRKNFEEELPKALFETGNELMRLSQKEVPHDEGTLQNSGTVEEVEGEVTAGYHTVYAARLHEHPEYRFQKGRKGKYLEDPILNNENALNLVFGQNLQMRMF